MHCFKQACIDQHGVDTAMGAVSGRGTLKAQPVEAFFVLTKTLCMPFFAVLLGCFINLHPHLLVCLVAMLTWGEEAARDRVSMLTRQQVCEHWLGEAWCTACVAVHLDMRADSFLHAYWPC